jgi:putative ABC transport system ATP-binding protein
MGLLRNLVSQFKQTVVIVTHDNEIAAAADRLLRMRDGMIADDQRSAAFAAAAGREGQLA